MKVTKFVHSCLLVETPKQTILLDPGEFSYQSHLLQLAAIRHLDYIVITHEHPDHYSSDFLKAICAKFPHSTIITNEELAQKLKDQKLRNPISTGSQQYIEVFPVSHEPLPLSLPRPAHIGVHIEDYLTCPGDALKIVSREVLALPITAPWGSFKQALDAAVKLKPKKVIPVHDWHWQKQAREGAYATAKELLATKDIEFIAIENAEPVEV